MPIYEYACQKCGKRLEAIQKFSDPLLTECPDCKGALKKLVSNTSFVLKGTGWYVTDFAGKKGKDTGSASVKATGDKQPGGADKPAGTASKTQKAPEAKPESKEKTPSAPASSSNP